MIQPVGGRRNGAGDVEFGAGEHINPKNGNDANFIVKLGIFNEPCQ